MIGGKRPQGAQPPGVPPGRASHVQTALARHAPPAVAQPVMAATPASAAAPPHLQNAVRPFGHPFARPVAAIAPGERAPHVQTALSRGRTPLPPASEETAGEAAGDFVAYEDRKNLGGPVPPPKRPVHVLRCDGDGSNCTLVSVENGRMKKAGTLYAGFVRMSRHGDVYVSERQAVDMPGDSHPSIASGTPEGRAGKKKIVAAGEIGIIDGEIVGHNDKTGHYQTRKNKQQSGLPADKFHPYTVHPKEWYKPSK